MPRGGAALRTDPRRGGGLALEAALALALGYMAAGLVAGCGSEGNGQLPVALDYPATVAGRVLDASSGAGLAGAAIRLEAGTTVLAATTDFLGGFEITQVPSGSYELRVTAPAYLQRTLGIFVAGGARVDREVRLDPLQAQGAIELVAIDSATLASLAGVAILVIETGATALTDGAGVALLPSLPEGTVTLRLSRAGYRTRLASIQVAAGQLATPRIPMVRGGSSLAGTVSSTPPLAPLPGALVSLPGLGLSTASGPGGGWRLDDVPDGPVDVLFSEFSHETLLVATSSVVGRITTLNVTLVKGFGEVQGFVRQFLGPGLPGASVSIPLAALTTTTDLSGFYRFPRVPAGPLVSIGAFAGGHVPEGLLIAVPAGGLVNQDFALFPDTGSVLGTVRSTQGPVIPGALVSLPALFRTTATDAFGLFGLGNLPAGSHLATVQAAGFTSLTTFVPVAAGAVTTRTLVLAVAP